MGAQNGSGGDPETAPSPFEAEALSSSAAAHANEAICALLERNIAEYRAFLLRMVRAIFPKRFQQSFDPSDVVQETLFRAQKHIGTARAVNDAQLRAWLAKILVNTLSTFVRKEMRQRPANGASLAPLIAEHPSAGSREVTGVPVARDPSPGSMASSVERLQSFGEALTSLSEAQLEAFQLRYGEALHVREIADRMARTVPSVTGLLQNALAKLRKLLVEE